jgi:hypothetical protein
MPRPSSVYNFRVRILKESVRIQFRNNKLDRTTPLFFCSIILLVMASLLLPVFAGVASSATVTVAWDPNPEPTVAGYNMYYGTTSGRYTNSVDVGSATRCAISALQEGVTYYLAVTAYDSAGNQSGYSDEITYSVPSGSDPAPAPSSNTASGGGGGGGCFIATAAFGSPMAPEVALLRAFRDSRLLTNSPGRLFIEFYYWISPPIADFISRDENLRQITRIILWPLVYGVKNITATVALIVSAMVLWILYGIDRGLRYSRRIVLFAERRKIVFRKCA